MLQVLATTSRTAVRFGTILVLAASLLTGVMAEASANAGCSENAVMSSCCCGDDVDLCADQGTAACAARCLCAPLQQWAAASPSAARTLPPPVAMALGDLPAPASHLSPPLTPPPIIRL
ncbi:MAG: hypothetical protein SFV19_18685 [Rhodospirillaceae bacterium]|nr:hypothetical protein [Rhodospirillaceae bacterium]